MPSKIRVTLIGGHLPPGGGREEFFRIASERVDRDIFDLRFLFFDRNPSNVNGVWHKKNLPFVRVVRDKIQFERAWSDLGGTDILQSHLNPSPEFLGAWCRAKVQVVHNMHIMSNKELLDEVVCVSRFVLTRQEPSSCPILIENGVDEAIYGGYVNDNIKQECKKRFDLPADAMVVGRVGYITPVKQVEQFVTLASRLLVKYPKLYFLSVGLNPPWGDKEAEEYLDQIKSLIGVLPNKNRFLLLGERTGKELADAYRAMDIFVQQSKFETFSRTVAEAMMSGVPCVVRQGSGMSELVGTHGFTINSNDQVVQAVELLLSDEGLRKKQGLASRERSLAHYSASRQISQFEKLWLTLARRKGIIAPEYSGYELKQKWGVTDGDRSILVLAPTDREYDFSNYLRESAKKLGIAKFDVLTYRDYKTTDVTLRSREFETARLRIMDAVKSGNYALVICLKMIEWTSAQLKELRSSNTKTKFVLWMTDITAEGAEEHWLLPLLKEVDHFFTTGRGIAQRYAKLGISSHWATEGFCDTFFHEAQADKKYDISFMGNINSLGGWTQGLGLGWQYPSREDLFRAIQRASKAKLHIWGALGGSQNPVMNEAFSKVVGASKIVLAPSGFKSPIWHEPYYSSNRLYLYLGCKGFVLAEYFDGIEDFFINHVDLVWFHSIEEMLALIEFYLPSEEKRTAIAARGFDKARRRFKTEFELKKVVSISYGRPSFEGYGWVD